MPEVLWIVPLFVAVAIAIRLIAGGMDRDRVRRYVQARGGRVRSQRWTPFGRGWFGSQNERLYEVRYVDADGDEHEATFKTSALAGVYTTEDRVVRRRTRDADERSRDELERENRALKERLAKLEGRERRSP